MRRFQPLGFASPYMTRCDMATLWSPYSPVSRGSLHASHLLVVDYRPLVGSSIDRLTVPPAYLLRLARQALAPALPAPERTFVVYATRLPSAKSRSVADDSAVRLALQVRVCRLAHGRSTVVDTAPPRSSQVPAHLAPAFTGGAGATSIAFAGDPRRRDNGFWFLRRRAD